MLVGSSGYFSWNVRDDVYGISFAMYYFLRKFTDDRNAACRF